MKTMSLHIDDNLYESLIALFKQFPENKIKILETPATPVRLDFEQASEYVLWVEKRVDIVFMQNVY